MPESPWPDVYKRQILKLLMQNPKQVLAKSVILDRISLDTPDCTDSSLKQHISNLRKKLREADGREYIEAVWGIGFKLSTNTVSYTHLDVYKRQTIAHEWHHPPQE